MSENNKPNYSFLSLCFFSIGEKRIAAIDRNSELRSETLNQFLSIFTVLEENKRILNLLKKMDFVYLKILNSFYDCQLQRIQFSNFEIFTNRIENISFEYSMHLNIADHRAVLSKEVTRKIFFSIFYSVSSKQLIYNFCSNEYRMSM